MLTKVHLIKQYKPQQGCRRGTPFIIIITCQRLGWFILKPFPTNIEYSLNHISISPHVKYEPYLDAIRQPASSSLSVNIPDKMVFSDGDLINTALKNFTQACITYHINNINKNKKIIPKQIGVLVHWDENICSDLDTKYSIFYSEITLTF